MDPVRIIPNPGSSSSPSSLPLLAAAAPVSTAPPPPVDVVYVPQASQAVVQVVPTDPEQVLMQARLRQVRQQQAQQAPLKAARRFAAVAQSILSEASGGQRRTRAASVAVGGPGDTVVPVERAPTPPPPVPPATVLPYDPVGYFFNRFCYTL